MFLMALLLQIDLLSLRRGLDVLFLMFQPSLIPGVGLRLTGLMVFHLWWLLEAQMVLWFPGGGGMYCCILG